MWTLNYNLGRLTLLVVIITNLVFSFPSDIKYEASREKRDLNAIQETLKKTLNPQPILDTITQAEMCCNNVQHVIGKKFVDTYEQISQVLSNVLQLPKQKISIISKGVTDVLDQLGGKLVGLYK
uniref:Putative secreted protein n=1 Tax=Panstrongylus lignarius TaxID=156445 RepID=A0A224Y0A9_9HEMI